MEIIWRNRFWLLQSGGQVTLRSSERSFFKPYVQRYLLGELCKASDRSFDTLSSEKYLQEILQRNRSTIYKSEVLSKDLRQ